MLHDLSDNLDRNHGPGACQITHMLPRASSYVCAMYVYVCSYVCEYVDMYVHMHMYVYM